MRSEFQRLSGGAVPGCDLLIIRRLPVHILWGSGNEHRFEIPDGEQRGKKSCNFMIKKK